VLSVRLRRGVFSAVLLLALTGGLYGCGCTDEGVPGIALTILDARTGGQISADLRDVQIVITEGDFSETSASGPAGRTLLVIERAGVYDIEVSAPGYVTWTRQDITVFDDRCHVDTVEIEALLEPNSAA
jgi:hypothetical protein